MALTSFLKLVFISYAVGSLGALSSRQDVFRVKFDLENLENGGNGNFTIEVHPEWAPLGAERFAELIEQRFFDDTRFYRAVTGFVAEFGISGDPAVTAAWAGKTLPDDEEPEVGNHRGTLSFVTDGKADRLTRISVNIKDNDYLDNRGYVPFAEVVEGMFTIDRLFNRYGGSVKLPTKPDARIAEAQGNAYLDSEFPKLTRIRSATIVAMPAPPAPETSTSSSALMLVVLGVFAVTGFLGRGWLLNSGSFAK
mmetsp:Transcript_59756/g.94930  ORF Transcript_59756/g.94930 Transcript_59756/m.94930 type:complete len:252 (+) Transcript_59756:88-843(+)